MERFDPLQQPTQTAPGPPSTMFVPPANTIATNTFMMKSLMQQQYQDNYAKSLAMADQPKRPLSAYNMFFQMERQRLVSQDNDDDDKDAKPFRYTKADVEKLSCALKTTSQKAKRPHRKMHGKITFIELAKTIASKWNGLSKEERKLFEDKADVLKRKYAVQLEVWLLRQTPTRQIKKRLSALRRGSLGEHLKQHKQEQQQQQLEEEEEEEEAVVVATTPPLPMKHPPARRVSSMSEPMSTSPPHREPSFVTSSSSIIAPITPEEFHRKKMQLDRARNLNRLYQMLIELYQEQVRLQQEYQQDEQVAHRPGDFGGAVVGMDQDEDAYYYYQHEPTRYPSAVPRAATSTTYHHGASHESYPEQQPHNAIEQEEDPSSLAYLYHPCDFDLDGHNLSDPLLDDAQDSGRVTPVPVDPFA